MYKRILMAYDGTLEGRRALREGALLSRQCGAKIYLLAVTPGSQMADAISGPSAEPDVYARILEDGVANAKLLGVDIESKLAHGDPTQVITAYAREIRADLVVLGHRRKSFFERWWAGSNQNFLVDNLNCSVLVGRNDVPDDDYLKNYADDKADAAV